MLTVGIVIGVSIYLLVLCGMSCQRFSKKGWLCDLFAFAFFVYGSVKFGFHPVFLIISIILLIVSIVIWVLIEKEETENQETANSLSGGVNSIFQNLADSASGGNSILGSIFGSAANEASSRINNKLGFNRVNPSELAGAGHGLNWFYVLSVIIYVVVSGIIYKVNN